MATLFLIVGLPAAGKTMRAMDLAEEHAALRLTPDAWMIPLFGDPQPAGKRDVLEGRLIWLALEVLRLGTNVVLDFGLWSRDERSSLRWLAGSVGASYQVVYLPVDRATQLERIKHRWTRTRSANSRQTAPAGSRMSLPLRTRHPDCEHLCGAREPERSRCCLLAEARP